MNRRMVPHNLKNRPTVGPFDLGELIMMGASSFLLGSFGLKDDYVLGLLFLGLGLIYLKKKLEPFYLRNAFERPSSFSWKNIDE
jgi:hypothetical protein